MAESQGTQQELWWPEEPWVSPRAVAVAVVLLVELLAEQLPYLGPDGFLPLPGLLCSSALVSTFATSLK